MANSTQSCASGQMQPTEIIEFAQCQVLQFRQHHFWLLERECYEGYTKWYWRKESNPSVNFGALVGGPDQKDEFHDQRFNYAQNEPSFSGNAPQIGVFARMPNLSSGKYMKDPSGTVTQLRARNAD